MYIHCVAKNVLPLTCYNLYVHSSIATIFGKNVADNEIEGLTGVAMATNFGNKIAITGFA